MFAYGRYNQIIGGTGLWESISMENLRAARERKNMTQKDVADNIGVAKSTYSLYESGNREPNVQTIKKLADLLNVSATTYWD